MDLYFRLVKMNHGQDQLIYAMSLLREDAQLWLNRFPVISQGGLPAQDWGEFKVLLRQEFIPINAVIQARDQLAVLTQTGTVTEYINEFRKLQLQIPDLSLGDALDRFVRGLKRPTRIAVRTRFPKTMAEAESLSLAIEAAAFEDGIPVPKQPAQPAVIPNEQDPDELYEPKVFLWSSQFLTLKKIVCPLCPAEKHVDLIVKKGPTKDPKARPVIDIEE